MAGPWIAVISADHAAAAARDGYFACSHGDGRAAARPANGDRFVYYAPRERLGAGEAVQAFVALGRVLDDAPSPRRIGSFEAQVRRAAYEPVGRAAVRPLLERLAFTRGKGSHWGMAFRRGLFAVSPEDFAVIEAALRDG
jgi:EVE domain